MTLFFVYSVWFCVVGAMCEKLTRCRSELSAAIQQALESPLPPAITHLLHARSFLLQCKASTWGQDAILGSPGGGISHFAEDLCDHNVNIQKPLFCGGNILPLPGVKWSSKTNLLRYKPVVMRIL